MADLESFQKVERTTLTMEEVAEYLGISYWLVGQLVRKMSYLISEWEGESYSERKLLITLWKNKKK